MLRVLFCFKQKTAYERLRSLVGSEMCIRDRPDTTATIAKDIGRKAMGGLLRNIPLVGSSVASNVAAEDPRYTLSLTNEQLDKAWDQVKHQFRECPTCLRIVCLSDWDEQSGSVSYTHLTLPTIYSV